MKTGTAVVPGVSYAGAGDLAIKVLNARNLAIAEAEGGYDVVAPCSSCYIQMIKVNHEIKENPKLLEEVNALPGGRRPEISGQFECTPYSGCAL